MRRLLGSATVRRCVWVPLVLRQRHIGPPSVDVSRDLRKVLGPNTTIPTARGRLCEVIRTVSKSHPVVHLQPMIALEIARLLVLECDALSDVSHFLGEEPVDMLFALAESLCGSMHALIASKERVLLLQHVFRVSQALRYLTDVEAVGHAEVRALCATTVRGMLTCCSECYRSDGPVEARYIPTTADALAMATWVHQMGHCHLVVGVSPLYVVFLRLAHVRMLSDCATSPWSNVSRIFDAHQDAAIVRDVVGEHLLLSPHTAIPSVARVCDWWRQTANMDTLRRDMQPTLQSLRTCVAVRDDSRIRQLMLQVAKTQANVLTPSVVVDLSLVDLALDVSVLSGGFFEARDTASPSSNGTPPLAHSDTYLRCLLPLKSWLDIVTSETSQRSIALSFQFVSSLLMLCLMELRSAVAEEPRQLLDHKPRVHMIAETAAVVQRMCTADISRGYFPEESDRREIQRCARSIVHVTKMLVRRAMSLKATAMREAGTMGALLSGGVGQDQLDPNTAMRNAAYRVIEPLTKRWYEFQMRLPNAFSASWEMALQLIQDLQLHVDLSHWMASHERVTLHHPMNCNLIALLETWRVVCFRATVVCTLRSWDVKERSNACPFLAEVNDAEASIQTVQTVIDVASVVMQRVADEMSTSMSERLPRCLLQASALALQALTVMLARNHKSAYNRMLHDVQELARRLESQMLAHDADKACGVDFGINATGAGDDMDGITTTGFAGPVALWSVSEAIALPLMETRKLSKQLANQLVPVTNVPVEGTPILVFTPQEALQQERIHTNTLHSPIVFPWTAWATACRPLRLYDEDESSIQSREAFEYGLSRVVAVDEDWDDTTKPAPQLLPLSLVHEVTLIMAAHAVS